MIRLGALAVVAIALTGCQKLENKLDKLPKATNGAYDLFEAAGSKLQVDPTQNDAISALGRCADLVTGCYRGDQGTLDDCIRTAPACTTKEPWKESADCCPVSCADAFDKERKQGTEALAAFEKVYFLQPDCFPGVMDAVGGTP